jgi:predicted DNA-binding protein (MmcQ/YjbR family)
MTNDSIRTLCLSLPHTSEVVQWGPHLLFKVAGKMFCIIDLEGHSCTFRCDPEEYAELVEMADIVPASHNMWKYYWVTTETLVALPEARFRELLTASYHIVRATLPKGVQAALDGAPAASTARPRPKKRTAAAKPTAVAKPTGKPTPRADAAPSGSRRRRHR